MNQPLKIAILGSAPSSVALAPYDDPSWVIWSCSPGARPFLKRTNVHFEMHLWEPEKPWFGGDYVAWLKQLPIPVVMLDKNPAVPSAVAYPKEEVMRKYGAPAVFHYTSSIAWMLALAIDQNPVEIGLWGVDMSAGEEIYTHQRSGCQYWLGKAMERGIKITLPPQSDLMRPTPLYGYNELEHMHAKLLVRNEELTARLRDAEGRYKQAEMDMFAFRGALDDLRYTKDTWISDALAEELLRGIGLLKPETPFQGNLSPQQAYEAQVGGEVATAVNDHFASESQPFPGPAPTVDWSSAAAPSYIDGV